LLKIQHFSLTFQMLSLYKLINLFPTLWQFKEKAKAQHIFTKQVLQPYWNNFPHLLPKDLRRMRDYPLQFIVFFAEIWADLLNKPLSIDERKRLVLYAAGGCLYDDFFDEAHLSPKSLQHIFLHPATYIPQNDKERVFIQIMTDLYAQGIPSPTKFEATFDLFFKAQIESQSQARQASLTPHQIWTISANKGGFALLLARHLLDTPLPAGEAEAVFQIGAWFQLLDDTLDIGKDLLNDVRTLITTSQDIRLIEQKLKTETNKVASFIQTLSYPEKKQRKAIFRFFVLSASGWIHIQRLKRLQNSSGQIFRPEKYPSHELQWVENNLSNFWYALPYLLF